MQIKHLLEDKAFLERELTESKSQLEEQLEHLKTETDAERKYMSNQLVRKTEELEELTNFRLEKHNLEHQVAQLQKDQDKAKAKSEGKQ